MPAEKEPKSFNIWQVLRGVFAAFLGVQSSSQGQQDFQHGRLGVYIAVGVVLTIAFVATLWTVVQIVLR